MLEEMDFVENKRLKVYLDTSVISYLKQDDAPYETQITNKLWDKFKLNLYDVFLSEVTLLEIDACPFEKRIYMYKRLEEISYEKLLLTSDCVLLSKEVIDKGYLTEKNLNDCYHIAVAIKGECDVLISWNFKHLVNVNTNRGVRAITTLNGQKGIDIIDPITLLNMEV